MINDEDGVFSVVDMLVTGIQKDGRSAYKRMLSLGDEIDKITSAINALERRIQKLETAVKRREYGIEHDINMC